MPESCLSHYHTSMALLYIVATPIGNLGDITLRALETMKNADVIACEDTRHTRKLLSACGISKPLVSCNAHKQRQGNRNIIDLLKEEKTVVYATDAGTPGLSDPGSLLVQEVRAAGFDIIPIPGPSAFSTLVSVSGFTGKSITFEGFLSPKGGKRKKRLEILLNRKEPFFIFESPYRVLKLLSDILSIDPDTPGVMGREMTKKYEEYIAGTAQELYTHLEDKEKIKGEFSFIFTGNKNT